MDRALAFRSSVVAALIALALTLSTRATAPAPSNAAAASPPFKATRAVLPGRFIPYETARYIVLSDADPKWSRQQSEHLERTYHQFMRNARRLGLEPEALRYKLVCVLFARRSDYRRFAQEQDGIANPWIAGHYAPDGDRIVFYHGASNPSVVEAHVRLDEMREELASIEGEARTAQRRGETDYARALQDHGRAYARHLDSERRRVARFESEISTATVVHEAIHQLLFHTRIQSPNRHYPIWLSEGLATAFETDDTRGAFGPNHEYAPRRNEFNQLQADRTLIPLQELVTWTAMPDDETKVHVSYHQSYALILWMCRFRQEELRQYLDALRQEPAGPIEKARCLELFEDAFGEVARLERAWLRAEAQRHD